MEIMMTERSTNFQMSMQARSGRNPLLSGADTLNTVGGSSHSSGPSVSSCSPSRPESEYFQELAELVQAEQETLLPSLQGSDKKQLRDMIRQLKEKKWGAVQEEDVSSSGPAVLASSIGPMVLEALDGFLFVLNADGMVEYASENVTKYLSFTQGDVMNKPICNFVMPGDHDFFSQLLPDSVGWMLQLGSKERRSQSFSCRFLVKPGAYNAKKEQLDPGLSNTGLGSLGFVTLHVSAISLPYPTDAHRDEDDLFNTLTAPPETGACLVCVARRLPPAVKPGGPANADVSRQFVVTCSSNGLIKNVEHRDFTVEGLFPKTLIGSQLESVCLGADLQVVRALLDHYASECSGVQSQLRFLVRGENASTILTVQARSRGINPDSKLVQLECTVTRADSSPNFMQSDPSDSNCYLSTNPHGSLSSSSFSAEANSDSAQQSFPKGQSTKDNPMSPPFHSPNIAGCSPRSQMMNQSQQHAQMAQSTNDQSFLVTQIPKYPGPPMLQSPPGEWNQSPNPNSISQSTHMMSPKSLPNRQLPSSTKMPMSHLSIAGQPQQFENLSPLPVEGSEVNERSSVSGQPDTLQRLCSSIFDETPPPSAASAPASSLMSPLNTESGMASPYSRAQSAFPDTSHMESMPHHLQQSPQMHPAYFQQQGGMYPQHSFPGNGNPNHHYHLFHPYSYPGERGTPAVISNNPDPLAPAPGPPAKGKAKKQRSKSGGNNANSTPKPPKPKRERKKKTPANSKASSASSTTVTTAPFMRNIVGEQTGMPCSMGSPPISSVMSASAMFSQERDEQQNTILKSLLQPEQLAQCGYGSPAGPNHQLLNQLLNEEEQSPPLVSSSTTSCQVASSEVSSTVYHQYPHQNSAAPTPSPNNSGRSGTPGSGGKRRPSASSDGPAAKQQSSPSVGSTTSTPGSVLVQLLQNNSSHTPTLPTSIATSPLDKLAKENKDKKKDNGHRISTTVAEQLNRSRNNPAAAKGQQAQTNPPGLAVSSPSVSTAQSTDSELSGQGVPQMIDRFGSPTHSSQGIEGVPYGQAMPYHPYYEGLPHSYAFPNGHPMAIRGQMIQRRMPMHMSEPGYPYGAKGPLPGMYGVISGMRQPMSAPPFMQVPGYPGSAPVSAAMVHPGTPYGIRGPAGSTVFSFDEVPYGQSSRLRSPCAQATPRPQMLPEAAQREAISAGMARQLSIAERQISYEIAPGRMGQLIDANMVKPPAYPGTIVSTGQATQLTTDSQESVGNDGGATNSTNQQSMEPSFFEGLGGFDLDDESTRNMVFQYLQ